MRAETRDKVNAVRTLERATAEVKLENQHLADVMNERRKAATRLGL